MSFPELAWLSHLHGSMSTGDMRASTERLEGIAADAKAIVQYGEDVRHNVIEFLRSNNATAFERIVPAHYGGEVTVIELLNIILRHSTHHLIQAYWFMDEELGITPKGRATEQDLEDIPTPVELI